jgi:hypothetical protein
VGVYVCWCKCKCVQKSQPSLRPKVTSALLMFTHTHAHTHAHTNASARAQVRSYTVHHTPVLSFTSCRLHATCFTMTSASWASISGKASLTASSGLPNSKSACPTRVITCVPKTYEQANSYKHNKHKEDRFAHSLSIDQIKSLIQNHTHFQVHSFIQPYYII